MTISIIEIIHKHYKVLVQTQTEILYVDYFNGHAFLDHIGCLEKFSSWSVAPGRCSVCGRYYSEANYKAFQIIGKFIK